VKNNESDKLLKKKQKQEFHAELMKVREALADIIALNVVHFLERKQSKQYNIAVVSTAMDAASLAIEGWLSVPVNRQDLLLDVGSRLYDKGFELAKNEVIKKK